MQFQKFNLPDELYYDENHFWLRPEGDVFVMGMSDFAQTLAGEIVYVQLPEEGKPLKAGKKFAAVESGKWLGKVLAPFDGELVGVNERLETEPALINKDCYGAGWLYRLKPAGSPDLSRFTHGPAAVEKWMQAEAEKHKDALKG
jgi:glycine cleavage system H protein